MSKYKKIIMVLMIAILTVSFFAVSKTLAKNIIFDPEGDNVGIGTSNPTSKLHVDGDIRLNGSLLGDVHGSRNLIANNVYDPVVTGYKYTSGRVLSSGSANRINFSKESSYSTNIAKVLTDGYYSVSFWYKVENYVSGTTVSVDINDQSIGTLDVSANKDWTFYSGTRYITTNTYGFIDMEGTYDADVTISDIVVIRSAKPAEQYIPATEDLIKYHSNGNVGINNLNPTYNLDVIGTGKFTGSVIVGPTISDSHAATKSYVDSMVLASGSGTVISVGSGTGLTGGPITTSGTINFDTTWGDDRYLTEDASDTMDAGTNTDLIIKSDDTGRSRISLYGDSQGTGQLYVGQSTTHGGGIEYNGDSSPGSSGAGSDYIALYRVSSSIWDWTARNLHNSNDWEFRGAVALGSVVNANHAATKSYVDSAIIPADGYIGNAGSHTAGGTLNMNNNSITNIQNITASERVLPNLVLDSTSSGDNWTSQGAYISIGETGALGAASLHMTYVGNGYGYIGNGSVVNGIPSSSYFSFYYNSNDIATNSELNMGNNKITNLASPVNVGDATTKSYVDSTIASSIGSSTYWTPNGTHIYNSNSGNIGIGTTEPGSKLEVSSSVWNSTNFLVEINNLDVNGADSRGLLVRGGANNNSTPILQVQDYGGNADFSVMGDGNVGIGTASPSNKLHIYDLNTNLRIQNSGFNTGQSSITFGHGGATYEKTGIVALSNGSWGKSDLYFALDSADDSGPIDLAADSKMIIKNDGNVGIGTTGPTEKLHVIGDAIFSGSVTLGSVVNPSHAATKSYVDSAASNADTVDSLHATSFLRSDTNDTFTGKLSVGSTGTRQAGMYGIYDSYKIGHIWSMGTAYVIPQDGSDFGNLYGLAYKHTNNTTGGTMAGGHQMVWVTNGTPEAAMGDSGIWTSGYLNAGTGNFSGGISATTGTFSGSVTVGTVTESSHAATKSYVDSAISGLSNEVKNLGTVTFSNSSNTENFINELESLGAFDNYHSIMKASWSYAGNSDISDTGYGTFELAGSVVETWTDNSSDVTRGNIHIRVTRPTTGPGGEQILVYNNQGSGYSPGWRQIWTSNTDGSNSGLDADALDAIDSASFLRSDANDTFTASSLTLDGGAYLNTRMIGSLGTELGVGAGEMWSTMNGNITGETLWLGGESGIKIVSSPDNMSSGWAGRHEATLVNTAGNSIFPGDITADAYYYSSDKRLKDNVISLGSESLGMIDKLNPVSFTWKEDGSASQGFIAQEIEQVLPELVKVNSETGMKAVQYGNLTAVLTAGIKEQQKEIERLENKIETLETKLNILLKR